MTRRRPAARFDELAPVESMEFGSVRDELGVADSVLSKQFKVLADAGYASTSKAAGDTGRARTWLTLTRDGRTAFSAHLEALRELAAAAEGASVAGAGVEGLDGDRGDHHGQSDDPQQ
jgi:DNA-binding MarR family transcriptional regulator